MKMNSLILLTIISCLLNQVICDSKFSPPADDFEKQKKLLKYWYTHTTDYLDLLPKFGLSDYYFCKKMLQSYYEPIDPSYSNSMDQDLRKRSDRLNKRFKNTNLMYDYKMNNLVQDELVPKPARKSDDPKIFRNLFLGSRG